MSGLAEILHNQHFTISGSDAKESALTKHLAEKDMQIFYGQTADNIIPGIDLIVYTAAISEDNPEFACAKATDTTQEIKIKENIFFITSVLSFINTH